MKITNKRLKREKKTLEAMTRLYCKDNHDSAQAMCTQCEELFHYACQRIDNCILGDKKTTCAKCPIHCFKPEYKDKIKKVMRHSGPKMIYKHPILAFYHLLDNKLKPILIKNRMPK
ncbi:MAG: hypothetical protein APF84_10365 [Gracilibacter sp. BRH_c7a]|nr:MAG: hypothetical protein APF84_10365 [Gracilibacter sp. BRH_c7a]